jgi:hypothetical protein
VEKIKFAMCKTFCNADHTPVILVLFRYKRLFFNN